MRRELFHASLLLGALTFAAAAAHGQQVVHALSGKVMAIYPATNSIKIVTDDGSMSLFEIMIKANTPLNFDKGVRAMTVPAGSFTKADDQVVLFFYGDDSIRTAVAVEDLGAAPLVKSVGTVVKLDKREHLLTITNNAGTEETFRIDAKTLGDGSQGVVKCDKFDLDKGAKVRITAISENGAQTALFIRALSL
jgi:uncharacterized protein YrzB (UPF0473 family)